MPFTKLSQLLQVRLKKTGIANQISTGQIFDICLEVMAEVVGPEVRTKMKPLRLKQGILEIGSMSEMLTARCKKFEKRIIFELNRPFAKRLVTKIKYLDH